MRKSDKKTTASKQQVLLCWLPMLGGMMVLSNVLASRIWGFEAFGYTWTFDAGIFTLPFICVALDILNERFGTKVADTATGWCCIVNIVAIGGIALANFLPTPAAIVNNDLTALLGLSLRVFIASVVGFYVSQILNNHVFDFFRQHLHRQTFDNRGWLSSTIARVVDTTLFHAIAFAWSIPAPILIRQALCGFVLAVGIEYVMYKIVARKLRYSEL